MKTLEEKMAKLKAEHEAELEGLQLEEAIREQIPAGDVPRQVYTGTRLYGCVASVSFGDSFTGHYTPAGEEPDPRYKNRTLSEALELLRALGAIVPFMEVRSGCVGLQPEDSIKAKDRERAEITGPYACKIVADHAGGAKLQAFVELLDGQRIDLSIQLERAERSYGSWTQISGHPQFDQSWKYRTDAARDLGEAKLIRYGSGADSGPRSGSRLVYLFTWAHDLNDLAGGDA